MLVFREPSLRNTSCVNIFGVCEHVMPITPSPSSSSLSTQPQVTDEGNAQEAASSTPTTSVAEDFDVNSANKVPSSNSPFLGEH